MSPIIWMRTVEAIPALLIRILVELIQVKMSEVKRVAAGRDATVSSRLSCKRSTPRFSRFFHATLPLCNH
jgi:hypothetical protein